MEEAMRQSLQEVLAGRQELQMLKPWEPIWQMSEEVVIQSNFSQQNKVTELIRQFFQPIIPQIDMREIRFALKVTWQEYFEVLQPQTELIPYEDVELAQFPFSMCFITSKNIGAQPLPMTCGFHHWHLGILLRILILWYLIPCLGDIFLNWICIKFGILLWELLLLVQ